MSARAWAAALVLSCAFAPVGAADVAPKMTKLPAALQRGSRATPEGLHMRVSISPAPARLGQRLHYVGKVFVGRGSKIRFEPPRSGGAFTWSTVTAKRRDETPPGQTHGSVDQSVALEADVQVFETGTVSIPGPRFTIDPVPGTNHAGVVRLPTLRILVLPTVTPADSDATLRAVRGPLAAPWWERLPWMAIAGIVLGLLALVALVTWLVRRARRPKVLPGAMPVVARRLDPATEALRALADLRARRLPEQGLFSDHALALSRLLRRFLEATVGTPRPGDTSAELLDRLRLGRIGPDDLARLEGLLDMWDRVKFARAPMSAEEAVRHEAAVEALVRQHQARTAAAAASAASGPPPRAGAPEAA